MLLCDGAPTGPRKRPVSLSFTCILGNWCGVVGCNTLITTLIGWFAGWGEVGRSDRSEAIGHVSLRKEEKADGIKIYGTPSPLRGLREFLLLPHK